MPYANNIRTAWAIQMQLTDTGTMYMTTAPRGFNYNGNWYTPSKILQTVGRVADVAKTNDSNLTLGFSGIDIQFKQALLDANNIGIGGRPCNIYRVFFTDSYAVESVKPRYFGVINSFSIEDNYETSLASTKPVTFSVIVNLKTQQQILKQRVAGRFTNQASMQTYYPEDTSFNLLPRLRDRVITMGKDL